MSKGRTLSVIMPYDRVYLCLSFKGRNEKVLFKTLDGRFTMQTAKKKKNEQK